MERRKPITGDLMHLIGTRELDSLKVLNNTFWSRKTP
jgi:hypothetical protein